MVTRTIKKQWVVADDGNIDNLHVLLNKLSYTDGLKLIDSYYKKALAQCKKHKGDPKTIRFGKLSSWYGTGGAWGAKGCLALQFDRPETDAELEYRQAKSDALIKWNAKQKKLEKERKARLIKKIEADLKKLKK